MKEDQKNRTLILVHSNYPWVAYANQNGYHVDQAFRSVKFFQRIVRKICIWFNWKRTIKFWIGDWIENIEQYDTVIIFASALFKPLFYWIQENCPKKRLICWYWDPFSDCKLRFRENEGIERWSFDDDDCKNYRMNYSKTFFTPRLQEHGEAKSLLYDAFFVGEDKGRYEKLMKLRSYLEGLGLTTYFIIVRDHKIFVENRGFKRRLYSDPIPEREATQCIMQSRILVDLYQKGQSGLSQRAVEAMLNGKKLITDNKNIKNYDFYNENNIFVLDDSNIHEIEGFLEKPFMKIESAVLQQYSFDSWFDRFFMNTKKL